ncbi:MAG: hypothetical protein JST40_14205 [Armatimonadetes bacterium]|nr:hypothetical protein [Armatimonadota bacterium]
MKRQWTLALTGLALLSMVGIFSVRSLAQGMAPDSAPGAPPQPGPGRPGMAPGMQGGGMMMGGGGAQMVADGGNLFILRGNEVIKINESNLKVVGTTQLPVPQGRFNGQPGGFGGGAPTRPADGMALPPEGPAKVGGGGNNVPSDSTTSKK